MHGPKYATFGGKLDPDSRDINNWLFDVFLNTSSAPHNDKPWFDKCIDTALEDYKKSHNQPLVVGLLGHAGVGKDSATSYLVDTVDAEAISFAAPLKRIASIVGFSKSQLTDRTLKETPDEFWGISPRQFLQMCGTEMFRKVWREDVWVEMARKTIRDLKPYGHVIFITDVRFPNEAQMIKDEGGIIVRIERPDNPHAINAQHASESQVDSIPYDMNVLNTCGSAEEWSWKFSKELIRLIKNNAFFY